MWGFAIVVATLAASVWLVQSQKKKVTSSWQQLASAVPDEAALDVPYRDAHVVPDALAPTSRKALALLPKSQATMKVQLVVATAIAPALAAAFVLFPSPLVGVAYGLVGAAIGLGQAASLLQDRRRAMGVLTLGAVPLAVFSVWPAVAIALTYGAARLVLDRKDAAGRDEAERERTSDPRYLVASREGRAAGVARSRALAGSAGPERPPGDSSGY